MPEQTGQGGVDRVGSLVEGYAELALDDLLQAGALPCLRAAVRISGGLKVTVTVEPAQQGDGTPEALTECDHLVEQLLRGAQYALSAKGIRKKLQKDNQLWGLATVKRSLAKLKRLGRVVASRKRPKGYWHADNHPLFRRKRA
jgi:hypothetical protein